MDDFSGGEGEEASKNNQKKVTSGKDDNDGEEDAVTKPAASEDETAKGDKEESKKETNSAVKKTKKKKKTGAGSHHHHKGFKMSKGYNIFRDIDGSCSPLPEGFSEEDIVTHVAGKKPLLGKVLRRDSDGICVRYRCYTYGVEYKPGDAVYIESNRSESPFYICAIQEFKMSKKETLMVHIKWFYRTHEVPEQVYQLLIQDRQTEHKHLNTELAKTVQLAEKAGEATETLAKPLKLDVSMLRMRELFTSDATDVHSVSVLRGKCDVYHCPDIRAIRDFVAQDNKFFFTLSYNPETRRLASTQGEIRIGASHQANLPELRPPPDNGAKENGVKDSGASTFASSGDNGSHNNSEDCNGGNSVDNSGDERDERDLEDLTWCPGKIHDHDLLMYLRAGRSMAAFASMCDGSNPDESFQCASRDSITANALQVLHEHEYEAGKAIQHLLKTPFPRASMGDIQHRWPDEDVKQFIKGLRTYGKDFFKIRVDFLPDKDTAELVEFYYLWKKTPGASNNRPRGRRPAVLRRPNKGGSGGPGVKGYKSSRNEDDPTDVSSASDGEEVELDFERKRKLKLEQNQVEKQQNGDGGSAGTAKQNGENGVNDTDGMADGDGAASAKDNAKDETNEQAEYSNPYYCRHCFASSSKDWHHSGKEKLLLCRDCRICFKKYGELPILEPLRREPTPSDFAVEDNEDAEVDVEPVEMKTEESISVKSESGESGVNAVKIEETPSLKSEVPAPQTLTSAPKPPLALKVPDIDEALNLNAIEQDSKLHHPFHPADSGGGGVGSSKPPAHKPQQPSPLLTRASPSSMKPPSVIGDLPRQPPQAHGSQPHGPFGAAGLPPPPLAPPHHSKFGLPHHPFGLAMPPHHPSLIPPGGLGPPPLLPSSRAPQSYPTHSRGGPPTMGHHPHQHPHPKPDGDVQVIHESRYSQSPHQQQPQNQQPRVPSPPAKIDGSECHRSQSAIFTKHWNRGENNSCARTDMHFKPVPDSPLARRRDDRLRKAAIEREESNLRQMAHAHQAQQAQAAHAAQQQQQEALAKFNAARAMDPFMSDPLAMHMRAAAAAAAGSPHTPSQTRPMSRGGPTPPRPSPFPPGHPLGAQAASMEQHMKQMEQHMERERMERREQEALRLSIGGSPQIPTRQSPFGPPGNPFPTGAGAPGPPPTPVSSAPPPVSTSMSLFPPPMGSTAGHSRADELAAARAVERQYAERMSQLATDPLVRLQMAGVNPEIPGAAHAMAAAALHPAYASLLGAAAAGAPNAATAAALQAAGLRPPTSAPPPPSPLPGLSDPRFRPPGSDLAAALRASHPGAPPNPGLPGLPPHLLPPVSQASMEMMQRQYAQAAELELQMRLHQQNSRP